MIRGMLIVLSMALWLSGAYAAVTADWEQVVADVAAKTDKTIYQAKGTFAVHTAFGMITVGMRGAATINDLCIRTGSFLFAPPLEIIVEPERGYLLFPQDKGGFYVPAQDDAVLVETTAYDLGVTPYGWARLLSGRMLHSDGFVLADDSDADCLVAKIGEESIYYYIDTRSKCLMAIEDSEHGWRLEYSQWQDITSGCVPKRVSILLNNKEMLRVNLYEVEEGTDGYSFKPPDDYHVISYEELKELQLEPEQSPQTDTSEQ